MAGFRLALTAHEHDRQSLLERFLHTANASAIKSLLLHLFVGDLAVDVAIRIVRLTTQQIAHVHIANILAAQGVLQLIFGKLRLVARIGRGAHINEESDIVGLQRLD